MEENRYIKDVSCLGITAMCKDIYDIWRGEVHSELCPGEIYKVTHIRMTSDFCYIWLEGKDGNYNSVSFDFFLDGKEHDIFSDERCWSDALIRRNEILQERYSREKKNQ